MRERLAPLFFLIVATGCAREPTTSARDTTKEHEAPSTPTGSAATPPRVAWPSASSAAPPDAGAPRAEPAKLTEADCAKMIRRFVTLVLDDPHVAESGGPAGVTDARQAEAWVRSRMPGLSGTEERCRSQGTRAHYDCAMASKSMTDWQRCTVFHLSPPLP